MVSVKIRDGVVDSMGGNAVKTVFHGIALALRNLVPGDGKLVRGNVIKCREFGIFCKGCRRTARQLAGSFFERPTHRTDVGAVRIARRILARPLEAGNEHGAVGVHHRIRRERERRSRAVHLEMHLVTVGLAAVRFRRFLEFLVADVRAHHPAIFALGGIEVFTFRGKDIFRTVIANCNRRVHDSRTELFNIIAKRIAEKRITRTMYTETLIVQRRDIRLEPVDGI